MFGNFSSGTADDDDCLTHNDQRSKIHTEDFILASCTPDDGTMQYFRQEQPFMLTFSPCRGGNKSRSVSDPTSRGLFLGPGRGVSTMVVEAQCVCACRRTLT